MWSLSQRKMETLKTRGAVEFGSGKGNPELKSEMGENSFPERVAPWPVTREGNKIGEMALPGLFSWLGHCPIPQKSCRFNLWSRHIPRLWVQSSFGAHMGDN